jgi:hypothetical protein
LFAAGGKPVREYRGNHLLRDKEFPMSDDTLRGDFTVITEPVKMNDPMRALIETLQRANSGRHNPIATVHREVVQAAARMYVPHISPSPSKDQFRDVADFLRNWGALGDRLAKIIGEVARSNTAETLDMRVFDGPFLGGIEGQALFELERCAQAVEAEEEAIGAAYADDEYEERRATE